MSPKSFTFKLTVPRDPQMAPLVAEVATHAVGYAEMNAAAGADLVKRVGAAIAVAVKAAGQPAIQIVVTGDATTLTVAIDATAVSAAHSA